MISKFLKPAIQVRTGYSLLQRKSSPLVVAVRRSGELLPPTQYDVPIPRKLHLTYVLRTYWEIIPLFLVTMTSLSLMCFSIAWACANKVDVVFSSRSRENISRTMDLRKPTIHKLLVINDRYEPWPEMQDSIDKMAEAEKRARYRMQSCTFA